MSWSYTEHSKIGTLKKDHLLKLKCWVGLVLFFRIRMKNKIGKGDKVKVEYEGKLESGEVFDSSKASGKYLEFVVGDKQVIPGFEEAIIGMEKREEKEITLEKEDAYGEYKEDLKKSVARSVLPKEQEPKKGMTLVIGTPEGYQIPAKIVDVEKDKIIIDLNHPLAGKKLIFKIKILEIEKNSK